MVPAPMSMHAREIVKNARIRETLQEHAQESVLRAREAHRAKDPRGGRLWVEIRPWRSEGLPTEVGLYASVGVTYCRNCGLVLPYDWRRVEKPCLCGSPDPAVLVPLSVIREFYPTAVQEALAEGRDKACA